MAKKNRSHSKVAELPEEIRAAVDRKILGGMTYREIVEYINGMGTPVSLASVGRYSQSFVSKMERLRLSRDQAKIIMENAKDGPALENLEAASLMAVQVIMERLIEMDDLKDAKSTEVIKALALLERSATQREKLKFDYSRGVHVAIEQIKDELKKELAMQPELMARLFAIVDAKADEARQK